MKQSSTWNCWLFEAQPAQKAQWPIWLGIRLVILGTGFNSHQTFGRYFWLIWQNLLGCNLGKPRMFCFLCKWLETWISNRSWKCFPTDWELFGWTVYLLGISWGIPSQADGFQGACVKVTGELSVHLELLKVWTNTTDKNLIACWILFVITYSW